MLCTRMSCRRPGAVILECAIVYPITFMLVLGLIIGGMGIFRYQEVASLAREGSRYAAVHGTQYALDMGKAAATAQDVYNQGILPKVVSLDLSQLTYNVTWTPDNREGSTVTVKVTYHWIPEAFFPTLYLSSTSAAVVSY